jgi:hypothetical protein
MPHTCTVGYEYRLTYTERLEGTFPAQARRIAEAIAATLPPAQRAPYLAVAGPGLAPDTPREAVADGR